MRVQTNGRGAFPKVTENTLALFRFEALTSADLVSARGLAALGPNAPTVVNGPLLKSHAYDGVNDFRRALALAGDPATLRGDFTATVVFRWTANPTATDFVLTFQGLADELEVNNHLFSLSGDLTGTPSRIRLRAIWEHGAGTNVSAFATTWRMRLGVYYWVTYRKRDPVAPEVGPKVLDLFVNGRLVETFTALINATGGDDGNWHFGGLLDAAGTGSGSHAAVDIAAYHVEGAALSDQEIRENARRGLLLGFPTKMHGRVELEDPSMTLVDMSNVEGVDYVQSFTVTEDNDSPMRTAEIELLREARNLSVVPLRDDSKLNLLDPDDPTSFNPLVEFNRDIILSWAEMPYLLSPETGDWEELFRGTLDTPRWGGAPTARIAARDLGAPLMDKYVLDIRDYPQTFGAGGCGADAAPIVDVIEEYLDDNGFTITVTQRSTSDWCVTLLTPKLARGHLLPTARALALQAGGFDLRYLWNPLTDAFELTFFEPGRDRPDVDTPLETTEVLAIDKAEIDRINIRNRWRVVFPDSAILDSNNNKLPNQVEASDAVSIARFNEVASELGESQTSVIDTTVEAQLLADNALADTKDPSVDAGVRLPLLPRLEVHDVLSMPGDLVYWTQKQDLAASRMTHRFARGADSATTAELRGNPSLSPRRYIEIESRAGRERPPLKDSLESIDERNVGTLLPIITDIIDRSDYLSSAGKFIGVKNGTLAQFTRDPAKAPPDGWKTATGTVWNTDVVRELTIARSGGSSLRFDSASKFVDSDLVPIPGAEESGKSLPYTIELSVARDANGIPFVQVGSATARFFDKDRAYIAGADTFFLPFLSAPADEFETVRHPEVNAPDNARFISVRISGGPAAGRLPFYFDQVQVYRTSREALATLQITTINRPNNTFDKVLLDDTTPVVGFEGPHDYGDNFDAATSKFIIRESGAYRVSAQVLMSKSSGGKIERAVLRIDRNGGADQYFSPGTGIERPGVLSARPSIELGRVWFDKGDELELFALFETVGAGTRAWIAGAEETFMFLKLVSTE